MTKQNSIHLSDLHFEHKQWNSELMFWKDEIPTFEHRLEEIVSRYTSKDVLSKLEHFQNQFMVQETNMNQIKHAINQHVKHMENDVAEHAQHLTKETIAEHDEARDKFMTQEKIFNELRHEFNRFLIKTM